MGWNSGICTDWINFVSVSYIDKTLKIKNVNTLTYPRFYVQNHFIYSTSAQRIVILLLLYQSILSVAVFEKVIEFVRSYSAKINFWFLTFSLPFLNRYYKSFHHFTSLMFLCRSGCPISCSVNVMPAQCSQNDQYLCENIKTFIHPMWLL